jgi:hypothetical protein
VSQRTCTGTIVKGGIRNQPWSGIHAYGAKATFFRKPDGTPWVKFNGWGFPSLSPVTEVGNMLQWTGHVVTTNSFDYYFQYTVWPDGDNHLNGAMGTINVDHFGVRYNLNRGTVDLTCATNVLPAVTSSWLYSTDTRMTPPGDPP